MKDLMMNDNNDFLKGYKDKNDNEEKPSPTSPKVEEVKEEMAFKEDNSFRKPQNPNPSRSYYQNNGGYNNSNKLKNTITIALSVFSVLLIIIAIFVFGGKKTDVPNFSGWKRNDFMLWASENEVLPQIDEQYNDNVEIDVIVSQNTAAGSKIKKGDFVKVAISLGPNLSIELDMPDIKNMSVSEIEQWSEQNRMSKIRITSEYSATVPLGNVIEYEINDNTVIDKVKRDTPIYIVISKGPEEEKVEEIKIPDFKTMGVSETVIFAQENGLNIKIEERYDEYIPQNSIISQSLKKDDIAYKGDNLTIIVSLGTKKLMISFKAFSQSEAASKASQLGVSYTISERYSSSSEGRLVWQSVDEGTEITDDMHLELRFSLGSKIFIGNYVGMKKSTIEKWLVDENALGARAKVNFTYTQNAAAPGTILQQSIADTYIYRDKTINVIVSSGAIIYTPDFVAPAGSTYDDAITREKATSLADGMDIILVFVSETNVSRLAGEVWYQSIAAGKEISAGTTITLKYNPIGATLEIPDFTGKTQAEVEVMSEYLKLDVTFEEGNYDINYAGKVYSQSLAQHTTVAQGTAITLYKSPETMVTVPDFTGMTQEEVENSADYDKLNIIFTTGDSGNAADAGKVYSQSVAAFSYVPKDTEVTLTLGTGS